jgi:hypothetical protein
MDLRLHNGDPLPPGQPCYAEAPIALGKASNGGLIEVFTSNSGATFTIIITMPDGSRRILEIYAKPNQSR